MMTALLLPALLSAATLWPPEPWNAPIIGVLAVPVGNSDCDTLYEAFGGGTACFHSIYVKWLEAAGARVVPLPFDIPQAELDQLLGSINGALITGARAVRQI